MPVSLEQFVTVVPKLRGPIQLAALAFTLISVVLIHNVKPDNLGSLGIAGAIGMGCLVIPLAFHRSLLMLIPTGQRAVFLVVILLVLLFSFGALGAITYRTLVASPDSARFDTKLSARELQVFTKPDGTARVQLGINFFPLSARVGEGATIIAGMVTIHDEDKISSAGVGRATPEPCSAVASCLGHVVLNNLATNPMLVRSASPGFTHHLTIDIKRVPKTMRIWWEFYQREGEAGAFCGFDNSVPSPAEGIPRLAMFRPSGKVADFCYRSSGQSSLSST